MKPPSLGHAHDIAGSNLWMHVLSPCIQTALLSGVIFLMSPPPYFPQTLSCALYCLCYPGPPSGNFVRQIQCDTGCIDVCQSYGIPPLPLPAAVGRAGVEGVTASPCAAASQEPLRPQDPSPPAATCLSLLVVGCPHSAALVSCIPPTLASPRRPRISPFAAASQTQGVFNKYLVALPPQKPSQHNGAHFLECATEGGGPPPTVLMQMNVLDLDGATNGVGGSSGCQRRTLHIHEMAEQLMRSDPELIRWVVWKFCMHGV